MPSPFHIWLIEDSPTDAKIIARALTEDDPDHTLTILPEGRLAISCLDRLRSSAGESEGWPDLILLDLNLPGLDGLELLTQIKSDPALKPIPVVVLSTTQQEHEVWTAYQAGANTFIQKPADYARYRELVATLRQYWKNTALRPSFQVRWRGDFSGPTDQA